MASWADVRRLALALPETSESGVYGNLGWRVRAGSKTNAFAWERPLRKKDLLELGDAAPPDGPILGARVADVGVKDALIASNPEVFFTIPHFAGYPAVLVLLDQISVEELDEVITDAWLARAPAKLAAAFLADQG